MFLTYFPWAVFLLFLHLLLPLSLQALPSAPKTIRGICLMVNQLRFTSDLLNRIILRIGIKKVKEYGVLIHSVGGVHGKSCLLEIKTGIEIFV